LIIEAKIMKKSEPAYSIRKNTQNNVFKFILILIVISVVIFSYQKDGFFFGI
tara:strand:- start:938 stop:1093 length:156 start_codon:yes stop_codon:yes gene_type:complete